MNFIMVGIAQLVSAPDCGSGGQGFESLYPPFSLVKCRNGTLGVIFIGLSPSGKAQHFDCCIPGPNPGSPVSQMFSSFGLCHLRIFHLHGRLLSPHSGMLLRAVTRLMRVFHVTA